MQIIDFKIESRFRVNRPRIRETIEKVLAEQNVKDSYEISVVVCGERKMRELHKRYMVNNNQETRNKQNPKSKSQITKKF